VGSATRLCCFCAQSSDSLCSLQVFVTELVPGDVSVCHADSHVAVCPVWSSHQQDVWRCPLCALRAAFPAARADEKESAAHASKKRALARRPSSSSDDDGDSTSSDSGDISPALKRHISAAMAPASGAASPLALPRTLGRPLGGGAEDGACTCGTRHPDAASTRANGPNPVFIRPAGSAAACVQHAAPSGGSGGADDGSGQPPVLLGYACLLRARGECFFVLDDPTHLMPACAIATCARRRAHSDEPGGPASEAPPLSHEPPQHPPTILACLFHPPADSAPSAALTQALATDNMVHCIGPKTTMGHLASAAIQLRLHAAAEALYPLPWAVQQQGGGDETSTLLMRFLFSGAVGAAPVMDTSLVPPQLGAADAAAVLAAAQQEMPPMGDTSHETAAVPPLAPKPSNAAAASALRARLTSGSSTAAAHVEAPAVAVPHEPSSIADAPHVLFLGTGCAEPSACRGASAILIRVPGRGSLLLDCGEGCVGAVTRALGPMEAGHVWATLAAVCITHHHADHMLGLPGVLAAVAASTRALHTPLPPPLIVGPPNAAAWLAGMPTAAWGGTQHTPPPLFVSLASLRSQANAQPAERALHETAFTRLGLARVLAVPVDHCPDAHALVVWHSTGWSVAYSGDGRPSTALAAAARGCTLLIHEATFGDKLQSHAQAKRHCTTGEALRVAAATQARHTVLTHFSQRYPRQVPITDPAHVRTTTVAFDGLRLRLDQLPEASAIAPRIDAALAMGGPALGDDNGDEQPR
jgi:ribonuclease BN (tRNA processing enzyme)